MKRPWLGIIFGQGRFEKKESPGVSDRASLPARRAVVATTAAAKVASAATT
ncbi:MAG: hypothetical protein H7Y30_09785, partial [Pyrinomonadaceae bacterium]|nr:hypothetical protein [Pyrinomonadaceae bacterium]